MPRHRRSAPLCAIALTLAMSCATGSPTARKYPPRGYGCKIAVYNDAVPPVKEWDDIGFTHVDCNLDIGKAQCLRKLRAEACRMGGDFIYDVPKKPLRPTDEGMVYAGHVAHTKVAAAVKADAEDDDKGNDDDNDRAPADTGPVVPIAPAGARPAADAAAD